MISNQHHSLARLSTAPLLRGVFVAVLLSSPALQAAPLFPEMPGMVSYTYREQFKVDVPGTLDTIHALGVRDMEFSNLFGKTAAEIREMLDARGMVCSSFGVSYDDAVNKTDEVAQNAITLGAKFVRVAWIPHTPPFTLEDTSKAVADFNRIGRHLRERHGLTFCYHNHGYEFAPHGEGTLFDVLAAETHPEDVSFELDILWAHFPGADPAALLEKYGRRRKFSEFANDNLLVYAQVESKKGYENLDGILAVEGLHAIAYGAFDLGNSMGLYGEGAGNPEIDRVQADMEVRARAAGKRISSDYFVDLGVIPALLSAGREFVQQHGDDAFPG